MDDDLTQEDLDKIDDLFDVMDINSDGSISLRELSQALAKQGNKPKNQEIMTMFSEADKDGDGEIDWSEFLQMTKEKMKAEKRKNQPKKSSLKMPKEEVKIVEPKEEVKIVEPKETKRKRSVTFDPKVKKSGLTTNKKTEILKMFNRMDPNGNGFVEKQEFSLFMRNQSTPLSKERIQNLYSNIQASTQLGTNLEEKGITFQDMIAYFEKEEVLGEPEPIDIDVDNIEVNDVGDLFALNVLTNKRLNLDAYQNLAGGINRNRRDTVKDTLKNMVKDMKSGDSLGDMETARWKPFASFKRRVDRKTVMHSPSGIVRDFLPGNYTTSDLVQFDDLPDIKPAMTIVEDIIWIQGAGPGMPGRLIFPDDFSGAIETDIATTETLAYYGAFLGESVQCNLTLDSRHVLQDFTYAPDYFEQWVKLGAGGAALETHNFAHLDCPLNPMKDSGYFILAKWVDEDHTSLEMTGFQVPTRHTIYTPGGVMHSNNYLQGTWRTMLADGPIDEAKLEPIEKFTFIK